MPVRKKKGQTVLAIALDPALHERLRRRADQERRTVKATATIAIEEYLRSKLKK